MVTPAVTVSITMNIPRWLRGVYRDGRREGRWASVEEMARAGGFHTATLNRWMTGRRNPEPVYCLRLAAAFGRPSREVLEMAGHDPEMFALLT
jgi:transcriptional regulator with XRE-family HTH domain